MTSEAECEGLLQVRNEYGSPDELRVRDLAYRNGGVFEPAIKLASTRQEGSTGHAERSGTSLHVE